MIRENELNVGTALICIKGLILRGNVPSEAVESILVGISLICMEGLRLLFGVVVLHGLYPVGTALICIEGLRRVAAISEADGIIASELP